MVGIEVIGAGVPSMQRVRGQLLSTCVSDRALLENAPTHVEFYRSVVFGFGQVLDASRKKVVSPALTSQLQSHRSQKPYLGPILC